jgi:acyl-CoA synthetase (AMP-forming)/AMP-acid ligase II
VKPGSDLTLDEVVAFLRGRVADYKLPEELVVMNDFPMTPTGKIRRPEPVKRVTGAAA